MRLVTIMLFLLAVPVSGLPAQSVADSAAVRAMSVSELIEGAPRGSAGRGEPELIGPGLISQPDRHETFPAIDPRDGSLWFSVYDDSFDEQTLMFARWTGAGWTEPEVAPFSGTWGDRAARFSVDGAMLYFTSNRPREPGGSSDDMNIWGVRRNAGAWGNPELVPGPLNSEANDIHSSATRRSMWVASRRTGSLGRSDIFRVGGDGTVEHLGPSINDGLSQSDLWVSPDESWMILVVTDHPDGHGGDDLFVSRFEGASWTVPENLGSEVNSEEYEYGPTVSPDGEYLYFSSHRRGSADLYRIRLSSVPTLASLSIGPNQEAAELEERARDFLERLRVASGTPAVSGAVALHGTVDSTAGAGFIDLANLVPVTGELGRPVGVGLGRR